MAIQRLCKGCGRSIITYDTITNRCVTCKKKRSSSKPRKPIRQLGKRGERYSVWLNVVARPYLDKRYGRDCARCKVPPPVNEETGEVGYHHAHHKQTRGSRPDKVQDVTNLIYLCGICHVIVHEEIDKSVDIV